MDDNPWTFVRDHMNIFDQLNVDDWLCRHMYQDELIERADWDRMKQPSDKFPDKEQRLLVDILPSKEDSWPKFCDILKRTNRGHLLERFELARKGGGAGSLILPGLQRVPNATLSLAERRTFSSSGILSSKQRSLDEQVSIETLRALHSKIFHKWILVARTLGPNCCLEDSEIDRVKSSAGTPQDHCYEILRVWSDKAKCEATVFELIKVLINHEVGLSDVAENVFGKELVQQCRQRCK